MSRNFWVSAVTAVLIFVSSAFATAHASPGLIVQDSDSATLSRLVAIGALCGLPDHGAGKVSNDYVLHSETPAISDAPTAVVNPSIAPCPHTGLRVARDSSTPLHGGCCIMACGSVFPNAAAAYLVMFDLDVDAGVTALACANVARVEAHLPAHYSRLLDGPDNPPPTHS